MSLIGLVLLALITYILRCGSNKVTLTMEQIYEFDPDIIIID